MGNNQVPNNRNKIRKFLYENSNQCFSPVTLSSILNIPNSSVRNELQVLLRIKHVEINNNPFGEDHLNYYTNESILQAAIDADNKATRRLKCREYDKTYRLKKKLDSNEL